MKIKLKDKSTRRGKIISKPDTILNVEVDKALELVNNYDIDIVEHMHNKKGKSIVFIQELIYKIGGIEEFLQNIAVEFSDYNITIMYKEGDFKQLLKLSKYVSLKKYNKEPEFVCDYLFINNYHLTKILNSHKVVFDKSYLIVHADFRGHLDLEDLKVRLHPRLTGYISVSPSAYDGLKEVFKKESIMISNFISDKLEEDKITKFIVLARATKEKGIEHIIALADAFRLYGKPFYIYLCSTLDQLQLHDDGTIYKKLKSFKEIIEFPPIMENKDLIKDCDYLIMPSHVESFGYAIHEALKRGVPVITMDFPEARRVVKDGINGYILKKDFSNLNVDKIFNNIPKDFKYDYKDNREEWKKKFKGE